MLKNPVARRAASLALFLLTLALGLPGLLRSASPANDYVTAWETRMTTVKNRLPPGLTTLGYLSDADLRPENLAPDDYIEYFLTQYSLAPILVQRGAQSNWVLLNSTDPTAPKWAAAHLLGWRLEKLGGGLYLLERAP